MINPITAWPLIRQNALKAQKTNTIWHSLVYHHEYRVVEVANEFLVIQRQGNFQPQILTSARVHQAANDFNLQNGFVPRGTLIDPTVAEETAFVMFHPKLTWDIDNENIIEHEIE